MKNRIIWGVVCLALGAAVLWAQKPPKSNDDFAKEWKEVSAKYPHVAKAYLQREVFIAAVSQAATKPVGGHSTCGGWDLCDLFKVVSLPIPRQCQRTIVPPPPIGSCFEPSKAGSQMPTPDEAQACVDEKFRGPRPGLPQ